jgi:hypothetical protein
METHCRAYSVTIVLSVTSMYWPRLSAAIVSAWKVSAARFC